MALRAYHETKWKMQITAPLIAIFILGFVGNAATSLTEAYAPNWAMKDIADKNGGSLVTESGWISFGYALGLIALSFLMTRRLCVFVGNFWEFRSLTFERVQRWADLIGECAETVRAPHMRPDLQAVSMRLAELRVRGARSMRGTVPTFSRRRPGLSNHARHVVATMRAAHAEFDVDRKEGARKLARLTLKISDRYSQGHVGALLDRDELAEMTPRSEALHLALMAGVMAAAGLCIQFLHTPVPLTVAATVFAAAWIYRSAAGAGLAVLAALVPLILQGK
ncbi:MULTISPECIES: hypothetical protein [unclassified Streptomyces]|uniref:hypothetical protein n=1 Tax=unclassified Streptomyces TaxID=2593676 RepID=UPI001370FCF2|nr:hypothetical protein [Streptomyces sp. SID6139]